TIVAAASPPTVTASTANLPYNSTTITINGTGFDPATASDTVVFNLGAAGTVTSATATQLTVTFSTQPAPGNLTAGVTYDGQSSGAPVQVATVVPANWIVTDANGNAGSGSANDITLPYAVAHAQNADAITFASSLTGGTITLNSALTISHNYTITGLG